MTQESKNIIADAVIEIVKIFNTTIITIPKTLPQLLMKVNSILEFLKRSKEYFDTIKGQLD